MKTPLWLKVLGKLKFNGCVCIGMYGYTFISLDEKKDVFMWKVVENYYTVHKAWKEMKVEFREQHSSVFTFSSNFL